MNEFFAQFVPSLLLFDSGDFVRLFGLLCVIMFCLFSLFFLAKKKNHENQEEIELAHRRGILVSLALFLSGVLGVVVLLEGGNGRVATPAQERLQELVASGSFVNTGKEGAVLGETDESRSDAAVPKSENYRLGFIAVGGDNQLYLANKEEGKLEISQIAYKTVIDENEENPGAIIRWETNKLTQGEVLYRKSSDKEFRSVQEGSFGLNHAIVLEKLDHRSVYVLLISAVDKWGNREKSENYALYSGSDSPSLFDLLSQSFGDMFGWAVRD